MRVVTNRLADAQTAMRLLREEEAKQAQCKLVAQAVPAPIKIIKEKPQPKPKKVGYTRGPYNKTKK